MALPVTITRVPGGKLRCTPPARIRTQAKSQRESDRLILASSGPPGRLSAKQSASDLSLQASTSVAPSVVSMPRSRRIRPRLAATLKLELPQAWMTSGSLRPGG
jgi:hypothetical protein